MAVPAPVAPPATRWHWLLYSFTRREVLNRYAGSVSGLAWTLVHPLAQLAIYAFVFSQVFRVSVPPGYGTAGYTAFVAIALWPWIMFSDGLQRGMGSIAANAGLIRKVAFPHRLVVYAAVLANFAVHLVGFLAVLVVLRVAGEPIRLLALPAALVLLIPYFLLAVGLGAFLAALQTLLRDVEHGLGVVLTIAFYATPILYPATLVPAAIRPYLGANPLAYLSDRLREVLLQGSWLTGTDLLVGLACALVCAAGLWFFNRLSPHFEDFL